MLSNRVLLEAVRMRLIAAVVVGCLSVGGVIAQTKAKTTAAAATTVPVVMLSDIHFDPFHDPAKVQQLRDAKVEAWEGILTSADSGGQATDFMNLERTCRMRGVDTPMSLLMSSLAAEKKQEPSPLFVTMSGDVMAHNFDCRFKSLFPKATEAEYSAFAAKTVAFIALELHKTFPQVPVYFALGNNDSGCKDYAEDSGSAYLKADAQSFASDALNATNSAAIAREFSHYGDYDVLLPWPMEHTRLIVLQDIFEARKFTDCDGTPDKNSAAVQIEWLRRELAAARAAHDHVWVMAHIPPGVDAYSTLSHGPAVCNGAGATMFLGTTDLADALEEYAGTVTLGLFGHTHMDEMKLLRGANGAAVPVKLVPSITPVNGNNPAFTVAKVDPKTATMMDYSVYSASWSPSGGQTGVATVWSKEYTYSSTYKEPDYSASSVQKLMVEFAEDRIGTSELSHAYQSFFFVGDPGVSANVKAAAMQLVWHGYACSMTEMSEDAFQNCACVKR